ncbi:zinc finger protein 85 isoform X1 [Bicyclus anynana]|uniref:Zinc finger protein 85 isoform X1 n=2 Tax=Bicyclus anynana TaxID=110368 RepID=A0ABM3M156_BICAN|nr:zinc finger protein 85 isoform X1 [Bicyclus anynana]
MGTTEATHYCLGCLSHSDDKQTGSYSIQSEALKAVLQVDNIMLCYMCMKFLLKSEQFIQNVQRNQKYLENFENIADSTRFVTQELVSLSVVSLYSFNLTCDSDDLEMPIVTEISSQTNEVAVKLEPKVELSLEYLGQEFVDEHDFQKSAIKEEKCILDNFKEENGQTLDNISLRQPKKVLKMKKIINKTKSAYKENRQVKEKKEKVKQQQKLGKDLNIQKLNISLEQCMKDRQTMREDPKYKNLYYKCEDCIKGYNFKESYDTHMEVHSKERGEFECEICKWRTNTTQKLLVHKQYHHIRYRCGECGLTRINRFTVKDHYIATHLNSVCQYKCSHCSKVFKRQVSLKKHLAFVHGNNKRIECKYCSKTFAHKEGIKSHIILKHPTTEEASGQTVTHHVCKECGAGFITPCLLKNHMTKHSEKRDFYCVECDKGFKTNNALKNHLKRAVPHVNYLELKLQCEHCEKRFGVTRDLERHTNKVHLNRRPYQCDKCERAYITMWALSQHKRFTHEGQKRPLKYPCSFCDKIFAGSGARKVHMRTHTGERPYACTKCAATFSQSAALATHNKLVHLRLTRDGQPKKQAASS